MCPLCETAQCSRDPHRYHTGKMTMTVAIDAAFETRWAAWQARGQAHEYARRDRMSILASMLWFALVGGYLWLDR